MHMIALQYNWEYQLRRHLYRNWSEYLDYSSNPKYAGDLTNDQPRALKLFRAKQNLYR